MALAGYGGYYDYYQSYDPAPPYDPAPYDVRRVGENGGVTYGRPVVPVNGNAPAASVPVGGPYQVNVAAPSGTSEKKTATKDDPKSKPHRGRIQLL